MGRFSGQCAMRRLCVVSATIWYMVAKCSLVEEKPQNVTSIHGWTKRQYQWWSWCIYYWSSFFHCQCKCTHLVKGRRKCLIRRRFLRHYVVNPFPLFICCSEGSTFCVNVEYRLGSNRSVGFSWRHPVVLAHARSHAFAYSSMVYSVVHWLVQALYKALSIITSCIHGYSAVPLTSTTQCIRLECGLGASMGDAWHQCLILRSHWQLRLWSLPGVQRGLCCLQEPMEQTGTAFSEIHSCHIPASLQTSIWVCK